jgi:hypothetical protein
MRDISGKMRKAVLILLPLILIFFLLNVTLYHYSRGYGEFVFVAEDDAYIAMRYARNLAEGNGLVWNTDERPVEGYTCFLWVLLLAFAGKLGGDMVLWSKIMGIAFAAAGILLTYYLPRHFWQESDSRLAGLFAAFVLAFSPSYVYWAGSGMETSLFTMLILLSLFLITKEELSPMHLVPLSLVLLLATLTRPEGALFFTLSVLLVFVRTIRNDFRSCFIRLASVTLPFLLLFIPYFMWRYSYYGFLLPNTYYAKVGGHGPGIAGGAEYALRFLKNAPWIVVVPLSLVVLWRERARLYFVLATTVLYALYVAAVGGDWMPLYRFFVPILPWLAMCLGLFAAWLLGRINARRQSAASKLAVVLVTFLALFVLNSHALYRSAYRKTDATRQLNSRFVAIGKYLGENYSPDTEAAVFPVGAISYYSDLKIIDMHGLSDVHIAHLDEPNYGESAPGSSSVPLLTGAAGHCKTDIPYVIGRRPTLLIGEPDLTFDPARTSKWDVEKVFASYPRDEYDLIVENIVSAGDPYFEKGAYFRYLRLKSYSKSQSAESLP